jgi:hypothetical protein
MLEIATKKVKDESLQHKITTEKGDKHFGEENNSS